jgi:hypothetical protein
MIICKSNSLLFLKSFLNSILFPSPRFFLYFSKREMKKKYFELFPKFNLVRRHGKTQTGGAPIKGEFDLNDIIANMTDAGDEFPDLKLADPSLGKFVSYEELEKIADMLPAEEEDPTVQQIQQTRDQLNKERMPSRISFLTRGKLKKRSGVMRLHDWKKRWRARTAAYEKLDVHIMKRKEELVENFKKAEKLEMRKEAEKEKLKEFAKTKFANNEDPRDFFASEKKKQKKKTANNIDKGEANLATMEKKREEEEEEEEDEEENYDDIFYYQDGDDEGGGDKENRGGKNLFPQW